MSTPTLRERLVPPTEESFTSRLRSPAVAARIGVWLGVCFAVAFLTGLVSHYAQNVSQPIPFPTRPAWGYRVTQGLHVASGTAAIPLLLVKLWTVYPKLFVRPSRDVRKLALEVLERGSIGLLVSSSIFMLASGLLNSAQWYPWEFSFRRTHYAMAWVAIGSLVVHIAVKLPVIRQALTSDVEDTSQDRPGATEQGALSRRGLLRSTWGAAGVAVLLTAGSTVPFLRRVSIFATRTGEGPQGVPINKTAAAARITDAMVGDDYRLTVVNGTREVSLSRAELEGLAQTTRDLPIACVEGWSAGATWTGVQVRALLDLVDAPADSTVLVESLQPSGPFRRTYLQGGFTESDQTLLALRINGEPLSRDHGEPVRLIAPNRPGVLQTKWVTRLEVTT